MGEGKEKIDNEGITIQLIAKVSTLTYYLN